MELELSYINIYHFYKIDYREICCIKLSRIIAHIKSNIVQRSIERQWLVIQLSTVHIYKTTNRDMFIVK